jgi:O-acetyl-ADP-ribose deacetylase (regulator of RNase III)
MTQINLILGDITKQKVDVIVNAANTSLLGGGGVDGAIHRAGGPAILFECQKIRAKQGGCKTGEAVITTAGKLNAKYVIHTVGPVYNKRKNQPEVKLASCYRNSLNLAIENDCKSIAFPGISTGIYGYPLEEAAQIAFNEITTFISNSNQLEEIRLIAFDKTNYEVLSNVFKEVLSK